VVSDVMVTRIRRLAFRGDMSVEESPSSGPTLCGDLASIKLVLSLFIQSCHVGLQIFLALRC